MSKYKEYLNDAKLLHDQIMSDDVNNVKAFLEKYPRVKFVSNEKGESAAATALRFNRVKLYELLLSRGLSLGPHEDIEELVQSMPVSEKRNLRDVHKIYFKDPSLKYLAALISRSKLSHDSSEHKRHEYFGMIVKAFEDLNKVEWLEPMLKLISEAEKLNIMFDFRRDSVELMDPTNDKRTRGICYHGKGDIYIGAAGFLSETKRFIALGVMAHELCHYAMKLVYQNRCKPYNEQDEPHHEFQEIFETCKQKKDAETTIFLVFNYPNHHQHAELIVRVPQLLALYHKNPGKLAELRSIFAELFHFYEFKTLPNVQKLHPLMEARRIVKDLNELIGFSDYLKHSECLFHQAFKFHFDASKISVITSNCPQLTMRAIHQQLSLQKTFESSYIFIKFESLCNDKIFQLVVKAFGVCTKPSVIINCDDQKSENILELTEKLNENDMKQRIVLVQNCSSLNDEADNHEVFHSWRQLTNETQELLLNYQIVFQGKLLTLKELVSGSSDMLDFVPLKDLLEEKIKVGKELKLDEKVDHVERTFWSPDEVDYAAGHRYFLKLTNDDLVENSKYRKVIIISNDAGMGKSTELKILSKTIKENFPSSWVEFIDLKEFVAAYKRDGKIFKSFDNQDDLSQYYCDKIFKINNFEAKVFTQLFKEGRVVLLMDGFDEISPSFKQFNLNLMTAIREKTENQLWVTTRPHLGHDLESALKKSAHALNNFTTEDCSTFLRQKLKGKNFEGEILESKLVEIENFLESLKGAPNVSIINVSVSNPLIIRMIAETFDDNEDLRLVQSNLSSIYEGFVKKMIKNYMKKGSEAEDELAAFCTSSTDIMAFHQKLAFETIFRIEKDKSFKLIEIIFAALKLPPVEQMVRVGLISVSSSEDYRFLHRTFAEFLIADFFFKKISNRNVDLSKAEIKLIQAALIPDSFEANYKMVKNFFDSALEPLSVEKDSEIVETIQKNFKKLFSLLNQKKIFTQFVSDGMINVIRLWQAIGQEPERMVHYDELLDRNAFKVGFEIQLIDNVEQLLLLAIEVHGSHVIKKVLLGDDYGMEMMMSAVINKDVKVLNFFFESSILPFSDEERKNLLLGKNDVGKNILMRLLQMEKFDRVLNVFNLMKLKCSVEELKQMLKSTDNSGWTILHFALNCLGNFKDLEFLRKFLDNELNLEEINEIFDKKNDYGQTAFMIGVASCRSKYILDFCWDWLLHRFPIEKERKKFLLQADGVNLTAFHLCLRFGDKDIFERLNEAYKNLFNLNEMKKIYSNKNSEGKNILHLAMKNLEGSNKINLFNKDELDFINTEEVPQSIETLPI